MAKARRSTKPRSTLARSTLAESRARREQREQRKEAQRLRNPQFLHPPLPPRLSICLECQQEFNGSTAFYHVTLGDTDCCSERCATLRTLSLVYELDKAALLPLLPKGTKGTRFVLEDLLARLKKPAD